MPPTQVRCKAPPHTCPRASPISSLKNAASLKSTSSIITRAIPRYVPSVDRGPTTSTYSLRQVKASSVRTIPIFLIAARSYVCFCTNTSYAPVCCSLFMRALAIAFTVLCTGRLQMCLCQYSSLFFLWRCCSSIYMCTSASTMCPVSIVRVKRVVFDTFGYQ